MGGFDCIIERLKTNTPQKPNLTIVKHLIKPTFKVSHLSFLFPNTSHPPPPPSHPFPPPISPIFLSFRSPLPSSYSRSPFCRFERFSTLPSYTNTWNNY